MIRLIILFTIVNFNCLISQCLRYDLPLSDEIEENVFKHEFFKTKDDESLIIIVDASEFIMFDPNEKFEVDIFNVDSIGNIIWKKNHLLVDDVKLKTDDSLKPTKYELEEISIIKNDDNNFEVAILYYDNQNNDKLFTAIIDQDGNIIKKNEYVFSEKKQYALYSSNNEFFVLSYENDDLKMKIFKSGEKVFDKTINSFKQENLQTIYFKNQKNSFIYLFKDDKNLNRIIKKEISKKDFSVDELKYESESLNMKKCQLIDLINDTLYLAERLNDENLNFELNLLKIDSTNKLYRKNLFVPQKKFPVNIRNYKGDEKNSCFGFNLLSNSPFVDTILNFRNINIIRYDGNEIFTYSWNEQIKGNPNVLGFYMENDSICIVLSFNTEEKRVYLSKIDINCYDSGIFNSSVVKSNIFPNPAIDKLNIKLESHSEINIQCEIVDIAGKKTGIMLYEYLTKGKYDFEIDISDLTDGVYFLLISSKGKKLSQKKFLKVNQN